MTLEQIAHLYVIFKTLQPEIKEWIASDDTSAIIKVIAARFILSDEQERILPLLILRLVTQDLPPESFKAELMKEAGVDADLAKNITEAIAKEIIEPIASALRYSGVNTSLLGFNAPAPTAQIKITPLAPTPQSTITESEIKPFILHEEPRATESISRGENRSFNYSPESGIAGKISPHVVIERVVHYSQLRTPLNVASSYKNTLNGDRVKPKLPQSKWFV